MMKKQLFPCRMLSVLLSLLLTCSAILPMLASAATTREATVTMPSLYGGAETASTVGEHSALEDAILHSWDTYAETLDVSAFHVNADEMKALLFDMYLYYPEYFYVEHRYSYRYRGDNVTELTNFYLYGQYPEDEVPSMRKVYAYAVSRILMGVQADWSEEETALYLHDAVCLSCTYDTDYLNYTAYDALVTGVAVCQGYALAYVDLMRACGIPCYVVSSASMVHGWNLVEIDGTYYYVDTTFDDPTSPRTTKALHTYFLCDEETMRSNDSHTGDDWYAVGLDSMPDVTDDSFTEQFWNQTNAPLAYNGSEWIMATWEENATNICAVTYDAETRSGKTRVLVTKKDLWESWEQPGRYWANTYTGVVYTQGKLYFSTPTEIYAMSSLDAAPTLVYTLTEKEQATGDIYGIYLDSDRQLVYELGTNPNKAMTAYSLKIWEPYVRGDFNGDGAVDTDDACAILKYYAQVLIGIQPTWSMEKLTAGDATQDGVIDCGDAVLVMRYYALLILDSDAKWSDL